MKNIKRQENAYRIVEQQKKEGKITSKPPLGYKIGLVNGERHVVIDPSPAALVKEAFALYASGLYALEQLSHILLENHNIWVARQTLHGIFQNPFYIGYIELKGERYPHIYERLIDEDLFNKTNDTLKRYRKKKVAYGEKPFFFRRMIKCERCTGYYTGEMHKSIVYYHCSQLRLKKHLHEDVKSAKELDMIAQVYTYASQFGVPHVLLADQRIFQRFCRLIFKEITGNGKNITFTLYEITFPVLELLTNEALYTAHEKKKSIDNEIVTTTYTDSLLLFCQEPRTIEEIMVHLGKDITETQHTLFDYQINNLLEEDLHGKWKTL